MKCLVTGATGFVGGHVAEALLARGDAVRTLARSSADTTLLRKWGVEIIAGDLTDPQAVAKAMDGVDVVVHCAAKVGEWGPIAEYREVNVNALDRLIDAACKQALKRFVLVSSLGVYPARDHQGSDETLPLPEKHIDAYTQTKAEGDRLALRRFQESKFPLVIIRPGFIYGPRDRTVMPRIQKNLRKGRVIYFGSRTKKLNNTYVGNLVQAILLAIDKPNILGQVYNVRDDVLVTKKVFFGTIAKLSGLSKPFLTLPLWLGKIVCFFLELGGKLIGVEPPLNSARLKFLGLNLDYSIDKAKRELGYAPKVAFEEGIQLAIDSLKNT